MDLERFYRRHARIYDATRFYLADRCRALDALDVRPGQRVIDFACGTGQNVRPLLDAGAEVVGVDASPAMLEIARRKAPGARFERGDVTTVDLPAADRALCTYALSMVPGWEAALRNMHRHLRPGGVLVVLDFDRLRGAWKAFDGLHRAWFRRFGVQPGRAYAEALSPLFEDVSREIRHGGWDVLVTAHRPRAPIAACERDGD